MSDARSEVLGRIRAALADVPAAERPEDVTVARGYRHTTSDARDEVIARFADRVRDYHADVQHVEGHDVARAVGDACRRLGLRRLAVASGAPAVWRPDGVELVEDSGLSAHELDAVDGALTGCAVAIAETGTLVLDGRGASGRRALTLVPDHHICVVQADQIVGSVPEAVAAVAGAVRQAGAPVTFVSGPSASSDIELSRVEGVHGPRQLLVLITES